MLDAGAERKGELVNSSLKPSDTMLKTQGSLDIVFQLDAKLRILPAIWVTGWVTHSKNEALTVRETLSATGSIGMISAITYRP